MTKIEPGNNEYFVIGGVSKQRGRYEPIVQGTKFALLRSDGTHLCTGEYTEFIDQNDGSFASAQAINDYVSGFIFLSTIV